MKEQAPKVGKSGRIIFVIPAEDKEILQEYAEAAKVTLSILMREAAQRMIDEINASEAETGIKHISLSPKIRPLHKSKK